MNKVFISRSDGQISWGFRLQGGFEDNEPLTLTHIQPNSPADGKIDSGDVLIEIAGTDVTSMTHQDALELIRRCGDALFLTIQKAGHSYPQTRKPLDRQLSYDYDQPSSPLFSMGDIPPAPIFDADLIANRAAAFRNRPSTSYEESPEFSPMPAAMAKNFGRPGGPKQFTFTPGGLNLSKLLDSGRDRRHRQQRSNSEATHDLEQIMNRRMIVPSEQMHQHHYAGTNPIIPFSYARQQPTLPKKHIQHDTDVITQSRSFQMLEGWITDSEKTVAALVGPSSSSSSAVARAVLDDQTQPGRHSSGSGPTSLPSRSFRYLQEQYSIDNPSTITTSSVQEPITPRDHGGLRRSSDAHTPSRSFKYLQDQYAVSEQLPANQSETINNRNDLMEIYHKPPPSFRQHEPEALRYTGSTVPSRSFRFLQKMTQEDQQNDPEPVSGYTKPQQLFLQTKYDEQNLTSNTNRLNEHPSRSFKYLQELTGEQPSSPRRLGTFTNENKSFDLATSDF